VKGEDLEEELVVGGVSEASVCQDFQKILVNLYSFRENLVEGTFLRVSLRGEERDKNVFLKHLYYPCTEVMLYEFLILAP
jgi:hypothetical protein